MSDFRVSVEKISEISAIPGKDKIVLATINGWKCIVKKEEFQVGDSGLFFPPDSLLPSSDDRFDFMLSKAFRVKTMKLGAAYSQGLLLPLKLFPEVTEPYQDNYAELLKVTKYERPQETNVKLMGKQKGLFPRGFRKTDQERVQNIADLLDNYYLTGNTYEVTEKLDGTSLTVIWERGQDIRVCSRNFELHEEADNLYWQMARKAFNPEVLEVLDKSSFNSLAFQGEIIGPGVQGNYYRLDEPEFYLFDIYDATPGIRNYFKPEPRSFLTAALKLKHVPYVTSFFGIKDTVESLLSYTITTCKKSLVNPAVKAEGLVFKACYPLAETFGNDKVMWEKGDLLSFKVINNEWLLENDG